MSKRGKGTAAGKSNIATNLRKYAAAEERLLDLFSPLASAEVATTNNDAATDAAGSAAAAAAAAGAALAAVNVAATASSEHVDPSRDNMLRYISDDSEIHSLLSSSDTSGFKGFIDENNAPLSLRELQQHPLIFGVCRNADNAELFTDNFMGCTTPKCTLLYTQSSNSIPDDNYLQACIANGNESNVEELVIESQNVIEDAHSECVIFDDENVVMLSDEQCCEIIVDAHGHGVDMDRGYLSELLPAATVAVDDEQHSSGDQHVYLSDAVLVEQQQLQEQLLLDAAEEDVQQVNDSFVDERPDICEVYDHELEEHDDEQQQQESSLQLELQQHMEAVQHEQDARIVIVSEMNEQQDENDNENEKKNEKVQNEQDVKEDKDATIVAPHSSTTEFPVSSTSMPNGSDNDDFDDELATGDNEQSPRLQRKYIKKNTLSAEAMDRRLANLGRSQPQLSLTEKVDSWSCEDNCHIVEDVVNFEAEFEQYEAAKQPKFGEFYDTVKVLKCEPILKIQQRATGGGVTCHMQTEDTHYSSDDMAMFKRPSHRRLQHTPPVEQSEQIVLDDDDNDCLKVEVNPSTITLVPQPLETTVVKTIETQTLAPPLLITKETSTTDLGNGITAASTKADQLEKCEEIAATDAVQQRVDAHKLRVAAGSEQSAHNEIVENQKSQQHSQQQQHQEHPQQQQQVEFAQPVHSNSIDHNDAQDYEQHEFCNYLGLTELATANAVATAMRDLANSNVARRSLRVRTQQQLDRMRSDVLGKRRERKQQTMQQREQQVEQNIGQLLTSDISSSSSSNNNANLMSSPKKAKDTALSGMATATGNATAATATVNFSAVPSNSEEAFVYAAADPAPTIVFDMPNVMEAGPAQTIVYDMPNVMAAGPAQTIEYFFRAEGTEQQEQQHAILDNSDYHRLSLEAAFAKVYAAAAPAAPAQPDLHECMQTRLRQARETKPSIYIVKALNNSAPSIHTGPLSPPIVAAEQPQPTTGAIKKSRKSHKPVPQKILGKRRRTTAGALTASAPPEREVITRSTTHMNSKLLRNRKVSLLKSYELSDTMAHGRGKQRLSGGAAGGGAGKRLPKPKAAKKTKKPATPLEQHSLAQQQQQTLPKSKHSKAHGEKDTVPKAVTRRKRLRAKSMPIPPQPMLVGDAPMEQLRLDADPRLMQFEATLPKPLMDTHEFITNHSMVTPPLYSAAVRRYVHAACKPNEQYSTDHQQQQQAQALAQQQQQTQTQTLAQQQTQSQSLTQQQVEGFFASMLGAPALVYPPISAPTSQRTPHFSRRTRQMAGSTAIIELDKMPNVQMTPPGALVALNKGSTTLRNPLAGKNGKVLYMYYELEQLIVLQEKLVSFWKYSKVFNVLHRPKKSDAKKTQSAAKQHLFNILKSNSNTNTNQAETDKIDEGSEQHWVHLGGTRRTTNDIEIITPYVNRICAHNSTPVYVEMRSHPLEHYRRESKLLSLYVNIYYFCEEEMRPKMSSVHLDSVNCEWNQVIYTTITDSRYFVMAWQQELVIGTARAGICKYSLTPQLDTLASIREFKQLRHELTHIECLTEDRLIGYGHSRITIWDHRSGDTLMNYDFGFQIGKNLGVIHYASFDIEQSSILVLYQHIKEPDKLPELRVIACEVSHSTPSHRLLHVHNLPSPQFDDQLVAINTGDHIILKSQTDDEIWISTTDPRQLTYLAPQGNQRYYTRQKSQIIIMTPQTLIVDSIANHVLKLATHQQNMMILAASEVASTSRSQLPVSM